MRDKREEEEDVRSLPTVIGEPTPKGYILRGPGPARTSELRTRGRRGPEKDLRWSPCWETEWIGDARRKLKPWDIEWGGLVVPTAAELLQEVFGEHIKSVSFPELVESVRSLEVHSCLKNEPSQPSDTEAL